VSSPALDQNDIGLQFGEGGIQVQPPIESGIDGDAAR
jgi:hypothetical protein